MRVAAASRWGGPLQQPGLPGGLSPPRAGDPSLRARDGNTPAAALGAPDVIPSPTSRPATVAPTPSSARTPAASLPVLRHLGCGAACRRRGSAADAWRPGATPAQVRNDLLGTADPVDSFGREPGRRRPGGRAGGGSARILPPVVTVTPPASPTADATPAFSLQRQSACRLPMRARRRPCGSCSSPFTPGTALADGATRSR